MLNGKLTLFGLYLRGVLDINDFLELSDKYYINLKV